MANRSSFVLPLALAAVVLGLAGFASWFLSRGEAPVAPISPVEVEEVDSAAGERVTRTNALEEPTSIAEPPLRLADERTEIEGGERSSIADAELEDAVWVTGRVIFPPGTPPGEEVEIVAEGKRFEHRDLHCVRVAADGSFRVAFSETTKRGRLRLDAPHLYLEEPESFDLSARSETILLEPALGGCVRGVVLPPPGATAAEEMAEDALVRLRGQTAVTRIDGRTQTSQAGVERSSKLDEDWRFELRGVPPGQSYGIAFDPECWTPVQIEDLRVAAGQTQALELRPSLGARVSGRLLDEAGATVSHAWVFARHERTDRQGWNARAGQLAGDGSFVIRGIPPGPIRLVAEKDGFLNAELDLGELADGAVRGDLQLRLTLGHALAGRVVWPDGTPAAGARFCITDQKAGPAGSVSSNLDPNRTRCCEIDGGFRVTGLRAGLYSVVAQAEREILPENAGAEHAKARTKKGPTWRVELRDVRADESALVLTLQPGPSVAGRVVDDTGAAITRFTVSATTRVHGVGTVSKKFESADGSFVLEGLQEGDWKVSARADGFVENLAVSLELPGHGEDLTIVLARVATLSGTVVDPDGRPVERARVRAEIVASGSRSSSSSGQGRQTDSTDEEGRFEIDEAPVGSVRLIASRDGLASSEPLFTDVPPAGRLDGLSLRLRRAGRLTGELHAGPGGRVDGRAVSILFLDGGEHQQTSTDAAGQFVFEGLDPGDHRVSAAPDEGEAVHPLREMVTVTIEEGETAHVVLGGTTVRVSGTVRRGASPVEGATIAVLKRQGTSVVQSLGVITDADGRYQLILERPGEYGFQIGGSLDGTQTKRDETIPEVASHTLDFNLPGGRISGRVLRPDGAPLAKAQVLIAIDREVAESRSESIYGWIDTDADGSFTFLDLTAGSYTVTSWGPRGPEPLYSGVNRGGLVLEEGGEIAGIELQLSEAASIEGTVRTASGQPVAGASISVWNESGRRDDDGDSDGTGHYRVSGLAAGAWSVSAHRDLEVAVPSAPLLLHAGGKAELDLTLGPGSLLRVVVEDASGEHVDAELSVRDESDREHGGLRPRSAGKAADGGTIIGPLAPGLYRVTATNQDGVSATQDVSVRGEAEHEVHLRIGG